MSPGMRWRDREWRWWAAAVAAAAALTALWPALDLHLAASFRADGRFPANDWPAVQAIYVAVPWVGRALGLLALLLVLLRGWPAPPWRRRWLLLGLATWLGVGVVVNGVLKEGWGRARPVAVLSGEAVFTPALRPTAQCRSNCSFVSGHAATGFVWGAMGLFSGPARRRRWLITGWALGVGLGLLRMAQGAHFFSDVLYSGLAIWACNLLIRAVWLRWRAWRLVRRRALPLNAGAGSGPAPSRAWFRTGGR